MVKEINMKLFLITTIMALALTFTGCYTVLWSPGEEVTSNDNYNYSDTDYYYQEPYYGPYAPYYSTPWWISLAPIVNQQVKQDQKERTAENTDLRRGGGRNPDNGRPIINTPPPAQNVGSTGSSGNSGNTKKEGSSDNSRNSTSSSNSSNNNGSNNGSVRNDNGDRNTDKGRR
jgi:hypothetical protein